MTPRPHPEATPSGSPRAVLLGRGLGLERGGRNLLSQVDVALSEGEILGVIGPNGAGKTSLLRLLAGLVAPSQGSVFLEGQPLADLPRKAVARRLAFLPQEIPADLSFTALEVALMGRSPHLGGLGLDGPEDRRIAEESLRATESLHLAARSFSSLSGGERQRVWLARALAQRAPIWLLDEPTSHLDLGHQRLVLRLLRRHKAQGGAAIAVLHDLSQAAWICDRVLLLHEGRAEALGPPEELLTPSRLEEVFGLRFTWGRPNARPLPFPDWS